MEGSRQMTTLIDVVFAWSLGDILDENLYKEKVKKIPESFETVKEYFSSYAYPLLEETRMDLYSSLEIMSGAPYAEVVSYVQVKSDGSSPRNRFRSFDIKVNDWRNRNVRGKEPYKTLPGDIFALMKCRPETVCDLNLVAQTWVLAHVKRIKGKVEDDDEEKEELSSTSFILELSKDIDLMDDNYSSLFVVYLFNMTTNKRLWSALCMQGNLKIINEGLHNNNQEENGHCSCSLINEECLSEDFPMEIPSNLNASQNEAVVASLKLTQCEHKPLIKLVWGPPGTGKTKTLSTLLYFLLKMNRRILICTPTNIAITQVAGRVLEFMKSSSEESDGFLGNILLFGNKQRLKLGSDIKDIYLDDRATRLAECFMPMTGWRSCLPLLANFLQDCVSDYNVFVENELMKCRNESEGKVDSAQQIILFVTFLEDRFKAAVKPVRKCITIFCTHLSKNLMGELNFVNMKTLWHVLDSFETLLLQDNVDSSELLEVFSSSNVTNIANGPILLEEKRRECISALRTLNTSLSKVELPTIRFSEFLGKESTKKTMRELCFQMASLVFCTASSAFKLYSLPVQPFDILVIDEAAQLKECESFIPLQLSGLRHAILFGDECQLPAIVKSNISSDAGFGRSLFQRLSLLGWPKHLLNVQYRMHPSVSAFPNENFYSNQILDAPSVTNKSYGRCYLPGPMYGPYSFINVSEGKEEFDEDGCSKRNLVEAAVVARILKNLYKLWHLSTQKLAIGVISPYGAQVLAIEEMLGRRYDKLENFAVKVKSVDGFQGGEEDIVIISTVRSNLLGSVGFISDLQRTNVSLTRARHCLWIIGHEGTLIHSGSIWKTLIYDAKQRHCFYQAEEDKSLAEAMIHIKKELDQHDDLLNKNSILFKSSRWKVLFSDTFVKTFSKLPSERTKKSVMNLLVKLSNGWRPKKIKADPVCESSLHIAKQYKVESRYVICTNDVMKDEKDCQVLKIWDIVLLEDVAKLVRRLDNIYGAFTDDFLSRCKESSREGELEVPRTWSTSLDIVRFKNSNCTASAATSDGDMDGINYAENAKVSESLLLMKFYSLSAATVGHLLSDADGRTLDLPFEVTDEEKRIIQHCRSSFILGRSGTGKTTVLTMKLFQKEQLHHRAVRGLVEAETDATITGVDEGGTREHVLRQLFVTVSPKLCYAIKQHVSQLKSFARSEVSSPESVPADVDYIDDRDQFRGIPDSFVGIPPNSYPLVITFSKLLLMLDGTLGTSFFDRFRGEMNLPDGGNSISRSTALLMKRKEVNYDKFSTFYWPHMNTQLTKKLDVSRVFTEIISSIKGGLQVGETVVNKLSIESYLHLSEGRSSTLSLLQREMIYNIFLNYEKLKVEREEFDLADLVNDLHQRFERDRYFGDSIDFIYIDEVQDLTIRQIALFKYICLNVDEGFIFSGDTAQTIARGIDFRFQDVRCLFFKEFVTRKRNEGDHENLEKGHISPMFHLSQNFRTHAGILKLGDSVVKLIYHFFPQSIDILPPETSFIYGEAPILLESGTDENAIVTIFGNTGNVGSNLVGFGAEQVILVRDECVREEILNYVGKHALVLTIVECKGLEFQDVLLYNFFGSSPFKNQWRVVYDYMKENNLLDSTLPEAFPDFNPAKHNVLCSELKQLYVAITRTRQRLWICENKENVSKPMFDYWKKKHAVQVRQLDDSLARAMQVASSPEEWRARGKKLLAVKNYEVATMCFERAGDTHWETYAKAAGLEASADRAQNCEEVSEVLRQAGNLFESINEYKRAADCYYESKDYDKAGRLYHQYCGESEVDRAGECFTLTGCHELAAQVYAKAKLFSECLSCCMKGGLFDTGLQFIYCWKHQATLSQCSLDKQKELDLIEKDFLENCASSYFEQGDKPGMMKFVKAFGSEDYMRKFLRNLDCHDELLMLEEELGNFSGAADIARDIGDLLLEANLLEKGGLYKEASALFLWYAFACCVCVDGGNGWPLKQLPLKVDVLLNAKKLARGVEPYLYYSTACIEVLILLNRNHSLSVLGELLVMCKKNTRGEILVTWKILDALLGTNVSKYECESRPVVDLFTHSTNMISHNKISAETLIYFWNSYTYTIFAIFKYLEAFEHDDETTDLAEIGEFCFNYLGVRKQSLNTSTVYVLYSEAKWLGDLNKRNLQKFGKLVCIDKQQLLTAARSYWSTELLSIGMKVLRILEELGRPTHNKGLVNPTHVYEVGQSLLCWKYLEHKSNDMRSLQKYIDLSTDRYFGYVFPQDWRKSVCKEMILLREKDIASKMLEEFVVKNIRGNGGLSYGRLGRITTALLGSCIGKMKLCETVLKRLDANPSWKPLIMMLSGRRCSEVSNDGQGQRDMPLALNLLNVLSELNGANWIRERDYITPVCFLYLVDRLMMSLIEFQGSLITCRSSLVEWLVHYKWKRTLSTYFVSNNDEAMWVDDTYLFLGSMVHEIIKNEQKTLCWVQNAGYLAKDYFHVLLLRFVVLMCLLQVNSQLCWKFLRDVLNTRHITNHLPTGFCNALRRNNQWVVNNFTVAEALKAIGDPLVAVSSGERCLNLSCKDAINLHMVNQSREDLLRTLFPDTVLIKHSPSGFNGPQLRKQDEGCTELKSGDTWEFFNLLELVKNEDDKSKQRLVSFAPRIKAQVDIAYNLLTSTIAQTSAKNASTGDESNVYAARADCLLLELRLLSAALDASGEQLRDSMLLIKDIFIRLKSEKPFLEQFLTLIPQKDANPLTVDAVKATDDKRLEDNERDKNNSSAADPGIQSSNQESEGHLEDEDDAQNGEDRNLEDSENDESSAAATFASENQNEGQGSKNNKGKVKAKKPRKKKNRKNKK